MKTSTKEVLAVAGVGLVAIGVLVLNHKPATPPAAAADANGWSTISQNSVPAAAIAGLDALINAGGAAWQPFHGTGPQSPPVASPGAYGPETFSGPCGNPGQPSCATLTGPYYAMDNATGQFYTHA